MVLTCLRGIFHWTLIAVQFTVCSWMSNGGLNRSGMNNNKHYTHPVSLLNAECWFTYLLGAQS
ncbi:hypothetical protein SRHO_G00256160 [Serrasalmus rhombeus]